MKTQTVTTATIEAIHDDFMSCGSKRLNYLKKERESLESPTNQDRINKLKALGFKSMQEVISEETRESDLAKINDEISTINSYLIKYPLYRYIAPHDALFLCEKYGLVIGSIEFYSGEIPDKNLEDMVNCTIDDSDKAQKYDLNAAVQYYDSLHALAMQNALVRTGISWSKVQPQPITATIKAHGLDIIATRDMFNIPMGYELKGSQIIQSPNQDPIVFQRVKHGYLIITAWGKEGEYVDLGKN